MGIQCNSENDCTTGNLCVNETCVPLTPANVAAKVPVWGWVIIVVVILLIVFLIVRCFCWPRKRDPNAKGSRLQSDKSGPAPLPKNYQKPVDLMEVADANKQAESIAMAQQKLTRQQPRFVQLRKTSNDSTVNPSSSISQAEYDTYQQPVFGPQQGYSQPQAPYGVQSYNQQGSSKQGYYDNNTAQYPSTDPFQSHNQNINNKLHYYEYEAHDYSYQPY